ncbi:MAG: hypothetical protein ABR543_18970 [Gemmatimonadaceae bacterium]
MPPSADRDPRRSLVERVTERLAGRGVSRGAVEDAVDRVVAVLEETGQWSRASAGETTVVAAISARSVPDLASRVRSDLERAGTVIEEMGIGTSGQYTVVTVRVPASARPALHRLAESSALALSFLDSTDAPAASQGK